MMKFSFACVFGPLVVAIPVAANLLGKPSRPLVAASWAPARAVRESLDEVLNSALGNDHKLTDVRIDHLTTQLRSLYAALPKNSKGRLGHATVRYALHRHFVHHHAMYVKGLEPAGEAWNSSSPADIMEDKIPGYVQHLFEERLHSGLDLKELAVMAAALEHFVHRENSLRLTQAYRLTGHESDVNGTLNISSLEYVLDVYMAIFVKGVEGHTGNVQKLLHDMRHDFPLWPKTQMLLRETQEEFLEKKDTELTSFAEAMTIIGSVMEIYGGLQNEDCKAMSHALLAKEDRGRGRVELKNFHKLGWQFQETEEYLQSMGAIDKSKKGTYVVISNYVMSAANCMTASSLYSVCCMDPCEDILRHVETRVKEPTATPEDLVNVVASLPSATVKAPRSLSPSLVQHLGDIAGHHEGRVPLHGRLFAQWLHHAYPRECPYPARIGTTRPLTAEDWMLESGKPAKVSLDYYKEDMEDDEVDPSVREEMEMVQVKDLADGDMESTLPWDAEEELVFHHNKPSLVSEMYTLLRAAAAIGVLYGFVSAVTQALAGLQSKPKSKAVL